MPLKDLSGRLSVTLTGGILRGSFVATAESLSTDVLLTRQADVAMIFVLSGLKNNQLLNTTRITN